jgi:hypothetical protein
LKEKDSSSESIQERERTVAYKICRKGRGQWLTEYAGKREDSGLQNMQDRERTVAQKMCRKEREQWLRKYAGTLPKPTKNMFNCIPLVVIISY